MPNLNELIGHWGYLAIFLVVVLGNLGIPVPEEAVLVLAGYLVWNGRLWLPAVLAVGMLSAVAGDNLGYWIGQRFGNVTIHRYGHRLLVSPQRIESIQSFVVRYGTLAVFVARFIPGLRFMAGLLAGSIGMPFISFFAANVLGALVYVPLAVAAGYAIGYGFADYLDRFERVVGKVEHIVLITVAISTVVILGWRALHARWTSSPPER